MIKFLRPHLPLLAIIAVSMVLQLITLGEWSYWFDEAFTSTLIQYDYSEIPYRTGLDVHPPLYYLLLKVWSGLLPFVEISWRLRLFSVALMCTAIWLSYRLVSLLAGRKAAYFSAMMVAIGPYVVRYGMEARMYALSACLILLMTIVFVHQTRSEKPWRWVVYSLLLGAVLYTHYFGALVLFSHGMYWILSLDKISFKPMSMLKALRVQWLMAAIGGFLLFAPWVPSLLDQLGHVNAGFWIPIISWNTFLNTLSQLLSFNSISSQFTGTLIAAVSLAIFAALTWAYGRYARQEGDLLRLNLLIGPVALGALVLAVYSVLPYTSSIYTDRYLSQLAPIFYAGLGLILYRLCSSKYAHKNILVAASILVSLVGVSSVLTGNGGPIGDGKFNDKSLAAYSVLTDEQKDLPVVTRDFWQYYTMAHYHQSNVYIHDKLDTGSRGAVLIYDRPDLHQSNVMSEEVLYVHDRSADDLGDSWRYVQNIYQTDGITIDLYRSTL